MRGNTNNSYANGRQQSSPQQFSQGNQRGANNYQYGSTDNFGNIAGPDSNGQMQLMKSDLSSYGDAGRNPYDVSIDVNSGGLRSSENNNRPRENLRRYNPMSDAPEQGFFSSNGQRNRNVRRYDPMYDAPEGTFAVDKDYERRRRNENLRRYDPMYDGPQGTYNPDEYNRSRRNENLRRYDPQYDMPEGTSASNFFYDRPNSNGGSRVGAADSNGRFDLMGNRPGAEPVSRRSQAEWSPFSSRSETTMYRNDMQAGPGYDGGRNLRRWSGADEQSGYYRDSVAENDWRYQGPYGEDNGRMMFGQGKQNLQPNTPEGLFNSQKNDRMFNDYSDVGRNRQRY